MGWSKGLQNINSYENQYGCNIDIISEYSLIDHQNLKAACEESSRKQKYEISNVQQKTINKCDFASTTHLLRKPRPIFSSMTMTTKSMITESRKLPPLFFTRPSCILLPLTPMGLVANTVPTFMSLQVMQPEKMATSIKSTLTWSELYPAQGTWTKHWQRPLHPT